MWIFLQHFHRVKAAEKRKNGWRIWTEQCWKEIRKYWRHVPCLEHSSTDATVDWFLYTGIILNHGVTSQLQTLSLVGGSNASCFGRLLHWRLDYLRHTHEEDGRRSLFSTQVPSRTSSVISPFEHSSSVCSYSGHNSTDRHHLVPENSWWQMFHRNDGSASERLITRRQTRITERQINTQLWQYGRCYLFLHSYPDGF